MRSTDPPSRGKRSTSTRLLDTGLALGSGLLLGAAFLPAPLGFVAWIAYIPLLAALDRRLRSGTRALFPLGYGFGLAFYLIGSYWIACLSDVAITVPWLKYPAWIAAAAYLALFPALAAWLAGVLARRAGVPLAWGFPLAMVAVEELRASGELGFPWFQPGYTQHAYGPVIQIASLGSVTLVTAWVLALNVLVWRAGAGRSRRRALLGALLVLLLPWSWGQRVLDAAPTGGGAVVSLIQGNIAGEIKWSGRHQTEIVARFLALSDSAVRATPRPTLVIWPETATGSYLRKQLDQALAMAAWSARARVPVFSGFADYAFDARGRAEHYNAAGLFDPDGTESPIYAKRHLVPFGERMPFQWLIPGLGRIDLGQAEWTSGRAPVLFPSANGRFGCLVCFESIFPDLSREDVRRGARWLVNITNDEWFGNSPALTQHAAMAVFRAVENHVPLARCANTGLTFLVDANGRVVERLPVFEPAILTGRLPHPGAPTLYTRLGDWPGLTSVAAVLLLLIGAPVGALTRRARPD